MNRKRVVFFHQTGRLAGLSQILGTTDVLPEHQDGDLPVALQAEREDGQKVQAELTQVDDRRVCYREAVA